MPLDAACLTALTRELAPVLVGSKVDKIFQPGRDEVILGLRSAGGNIRLLLTANPAQPRLQLTEKSRENPASPPMFCMLLRKHLTGARILSLTQPPMERVADLELETRNELGDIVSRHLILEAMGRRANLILTDENGRITDCLRKVDSEMSQLRPVLPGLFYRLPPAREGLENPLALDEEERNALIAAAPPERRMSDWVLDTFAGFSPLIARELAWRATGDTEGRMEQGREALARALNGLCRALEGGETGAYALYRQGSPKDFSFLPMGQYEGAMEVRRFDSFSLLMDAFYAQRENSQRVRQKGQELIRNLTNARNRTARKIQIQTRELAAARDREQYRISGDLITANLYQMRKGERSLTAVNYYDPECREMTVALDPLLTPQQNAAKYYKRYTKAKTADAVLTGQLTQAKQELDYLESVLETVNRATGESDLTEIRQELEDQGYLRRPKAGKKAMKRPKPKPMEFRSSAGLRISVGRNNTQNDLLTCKLAGKGDWWFHTQGIHGAHVILWTEGAEPDEDSVRQAALLAAWFSQGRQSGRVPVDYTPVKYVKKPAGAKPGMVIYTTCRTLFLTPEEGEVRELIGQ